MTNNYTDTQLKQALEKMLPEKLWFRDLDKTLCYNHNKYDKVLDTELLHLCWLVEDDLEFKQIHTFVQNLYNVTATQTDGVTAGPSGRWLMAHATWQQRTITLCKVKGIEI